MGRFWTGVLVGAVAAVLAGLLILAVPGRDAHQPDLSQLNTAQLSDDKLRAEIRQLADQHAAATDGWQRLLDWAPFLTAFAAIATVGATLRQQRLDLAAERQKSSDERDQARQAERQWRESFEETLRTNRAQQEAESLRRFDATMAQTITSLGSESETVRVNAAAALTSYLHPRYASFHPDLLAVVAANLQLRPTPAVSRVLTRDLERLLRLIYHPANTAERPAILDLSRANAPRLDLTGLVLRPTVLDVAFAKLAEARLVEADLFRLRGIQVDLTKAYCSRANLGEARLRSAVLRDAVLHEARLVSAALQQADLAGAQLQRALLQEAHLEGADLRGANFTGANLANTYFRGAVFDEPALRSLAGGALNWRPNQNFDPATKQQLLEIAQQLANRTHPAGEPPPEQDATDAG